MEPYALVMAGLFLLFCVILGVMWRFFHVDEAREQQEEQERSRPELPGDETRR